MAIRNIRLTISYDGVNYSGWQNQPEKFTIQGELERVLSELTALEVPINGASRTDAGVSALGQVANFLIDSPIPTENFAKAINHRLPKDIFVLDAEQVDRNFDASVSAKNKLYRYIIFTADKPNVLQIRNCWFRPGELDVAAMNKAAGMLVGTHDFKSFAAAADNRENTVRMVMECRVYGDGQWVYMEIRADRFLYNMVRNIVGTLVEIGTGKWPPEKIKEILAAKDRTAAGPIAPPQGLCLVSITY